MDSWTQISQKRSLCHATGVWCPFQMLQKWAVGCWIWSVKILRLVQFHDRWIRILCLWLFCRLASFLITSGRMSKICKPCGRNVWRLWADIKDPLFMITNKKSLTAICLLLDSYLSYSLTLIHKRPCLPTVNHVIVRCHLNPKIKYLIFACINYPVYAHNNSRNV